MCSPVQQSSCRERFLGIQTAASESIEAVCPDAATVAGTTFARRSGTQFASLANDRRHIISNHQLLETTILQALLEELDSGENTRSPSIDFVLSHLPPRLSAVAMNRDGGDEAPSMPSLIEELSSAQDALLCELQREGLSLSMDEVRALCRAVHRGLTATAAALLTDSEYTLPKEENPRVTADHGARPTLDGRPNYASYLPDAWLRNARHELRTPLQAILGWVSLLKSGQLPPHGQARAFEAIERNAKLQSHLISTVLNMP